jgi:hypothetical protein
MEPFAKIQGKGQRSRHQQAVGARKGQHHLDAGRGEAYRQGVRHAARKAWVVPPCELPDIELPGLCAIILLSSP